MKFKKIMALALAVVMTASMAVGCGGKKEEAAKGRFSRRCENLL